MTYVYLDDRLDEHPKMEMLSDAAFAMHIRALCYVQRSSNNSRGFIPVSRVGKLTTAEKPLEIAQELVKAIPPGHDAGLWEEVDGGFVIHDYAEFYEKSLARKERARNAAKARHGKKQDPAPAKNDAPGMLGAETEQETSRVGASPNDAIPQTPNPTEVTSVKKPSSADTPEQDFDDDDQDFSQVLDATWERMAADDLAAAITANGPVRAPDRWLNKAKHNLWLQLHSKALDLLRRNPNLTSAELAAQLRHPGRRTSLAVVEGEMARSLRPFGDDEPPPGDECFGTDERGNLLFLPGGKS
jgi:hypothetical protein